MNGSARFLGFSTIAWSILTLAGFALMALLAPLREYDVYNLAGGMRALEESPFLVIAGPLAFAWAGVVLIFMALAFNEWLPESASSFPLRIASIFAWIAAAFFLFYGLVGGLAFFELRYIQSVHSIEYARGAYLPLTLVMNRVFAAAITVSGLWFALVNWIALREDALPRPTAYLGLAAGLLALPGFVLPGGGFGPLSLLLGAGWGILVGLRLLRSWPAFAPG